jgi:hypothetical protein
VWSECVVDACLYRAGHAYLAEIANLNARAKTCCAKEILVPMLRAHDGQGRELHIQRAPTRRSAAALPNPRR